MEEKCERPVTCDFWRDIETCKRPEKGQNHNDWALSNRMSKIKKKIIFLTSIQNNRL